MEVQIIYRNDVEHASKMNLQRKILKKKSLKVVVENKTEAYKFQV